MRLLKLRFKNLNSLVGEWEIDFRKPEYTSERLFIITGPTGSGKTTILDALCLALYGQTPRLKTISENTNEIMSRQTGDCYAEATFQAQGGTYRASFRQRRTDKAPKPFERSHQEIVLDDTGEILENSINNKLAKVTELVGMDFDRFTKSILLAQGGFAAFLEAKPENRSQILEHIMGTEIYGRISALAFRRATDAANDLKILETELAGLEILTDDQKAELEAMVTKLRERDETIDKQARKDRLALNWRQKMSQLREELASLAQKNQTVDQDIEAFKPLAEKLIWAQKALELESSYETLRGLRQTQEKDNQALDLERQRTASLTGEREQAQVKSEEAEQSIAQKEANRQAARPVIERAKNLDQQVADLSEPLKVQAQEVQKLQARQTGLEKKLKDARNDQARLEKDLTQTLNQLQQRAADQALGEDLAGLEHEADFLSSALKQVQTAQKELDRTKESLATIELNRQKASQARELSQNALANLEKEKSRLNDSLEELTRPSRADWRLREEKAQENLLLLTEAKDQDAKIAALKDTGQDFLTQKKALTLQVTDHSQEEERLKLTSAALEKQVELLTTNRDLAQSVASLEARRAELKPDQPCPLCGSLDHPYALGAPALLTEADRDLDTAKSEFKKNQTNLTTLAKTLADKNARLKSLDFLIANNDQEKDQLAKRLLAALASAPPDWNLPSAGDPQLAERLAQQLERTQTERAAIRERLAKADQLAEEIAKLTDKSQKAQKELAIFQSRELETTLGLETTNADINRLTQTAQDLQAQAQERTSALTDKLAPYGYPDLAKLELKKIISQLRERKDLWQKLSATRLELEKNLFAINNSLETDTANLAVLTKDLAEKNQAWEVSQSHRAELMAQRRELLGDLDPDTESKKLELEVQTAEKNFKNLDQLRRNVDTNLKISQDKALNLEKALHERQEQIVAELSSFNEGLVDKGFVDEATFVQARSPRDKREKLISQRDELATRKTNISSLINDKTEQLTKEEATALSDLTESELTEAINASDQTLKEIREAIGSNKEKLDIDLKNRRLFETKRSQANDQRSVWQSLDKLSSHIGAASGKPYRLFAQSLAFERLVQNANAQLIKMSNRYLMLQDENTPMELNVIDNDQGGIVRPTKNLSGGETFQVSLALALGLSFMASENVEVNSLFLDEGFGTLDEDTLELALSALTELPQAEGKTIGLISHVAGLEQRIATQIRVTPLPPGGRSRLDGPGCRQL
ncbi:MAG: AAA family ATPase [Deltaproteobacteria bacterium]|jgi:exonuclease SbcC|nr:AAA family ATPase [Deltaproteobacteria bacterium]